MVSYDEVRLTEFERFELAPRWAHRRWMNALERKYKDTLKPIKIDGLESHYWGFCGEIAYARAHNVYFDPTCDTYKAPDVGNTWIRTGTKYRYGLIIREKDPDSGFFVLVTVDPATPSVFHVYNGGMFASDAKKHREWLRDPDDQGPAWFVPQAFLVPQPQAIATAR